MNTLYRSLFLVSLLYSPFANAIIIDFEEIDNTAGNVFEMSLDSQGFNFLNNGNNNSILHWASLSSNNADLGGVTYSHNYSGTTTTLTEIGGGAFDLASIDFGDVFNRGTSQEILVTGFFGGGGSIADIITTDALLGLETFAFNWEGLTSVTWIENTGNYLQLDNVVLNEAESSVPEPSIIALFALGLFGIGFARRRKA